MKSSVARFFCWLLAIASLLVAIVILADPIFEFDLTLIITLNLPWCFHPDATLMDFAKIPWCAVALFSPCIFLALFASLSGENVKGVLLRALLPLGLLIFALFCGSSPDSSSSEQTLELLLYGVASFLYIVSSFVFFYNIITGDEWGYSSETSSDPITDLLSNMTDDDSDD